jgi:hypothetical protein
MKFLTKTMYRVLLGLFALAAIFMSIQPYIDGGSFVEPISVILLAIILYFVLRWIYQKLAKVSSKILKFLIFGLFAVFVLLQIVSINAVHLMTFGDPWHIATQAFKLVQGNNTWDVWLRMYPNLVPLLALNVGFVKVAGWLGLSYWAIFYTFNLLVNTVIWIVITRFLWKKSQSLAAFVMILAVLMPMNYDFLLRVGYSDGLAILALVLLAVKFDKALQTQKFGVGAFLTVILYFALGYLARPNMVIVLVALVICGIVAFCEREKYKNLWKSTSKMLIACMVGILFAIGATHVLASALDYNLKNTDAFPIVNWFYESVNYASMGQWTPVDRDYTLYHEGYRTAQAADIAGIKSRLVSLGEHPWQIPVLLLVKFGTLWSCGNFATGTDYQEFRLTFDFTHGPGWVIANIGAINMFLSTYAKALMTVFLLSILSRLWREKKVEISVFGLSILTIMGISLFHTLLWEVKPRYQFMTIGLIVIAAALSFDGLFSTKTLEEKAARLNKKKWLKIGFPIASILSVLLMATVMQLQPKQMVVVNAQSHALDNYTCGNNVYTLSPNQVISQEFKLSTDAAQVDLESNSTGDLQLFLVKKIGNDWKAVARQPIVADEPDTIINTHLSAGTYQFVVKNETNLPVSLEVMLNTQNEDIPYLISLPHHQTGSFGWTVNDGEKTKFPVGLIVVFGLIFLLGYLFILKGPIND